MLNSFNFAIEHGAFHRDQKTSLISLLLKKGKDPLDCSSYRPISLIPCDLKIYAKIFASRLEKVIHSLIKEDQTGFIKGRNASDNMRRLLHILDFADSHPTPCAVFSLDAEKSLWQARVELYVGGSAMFRLRWTLRFLWLRHYTTHLQHQS